MERMLNPKQVAELLCVSESTARARMEEMPGCIDIGNGKSQILRVPESGLDAWMSNRVVTLRPAASRIARRKNGKLVAV